MASEVPEQRYMKRVQRARASRGQVLVDVVCPDCGGVVATISDTPEGPLYESEFPLFELLVEGKPMRSEEHVLVNVPAGERQNQPTPLRAHCDTDGVLEVDDEDALRAASMASESEARPVKLPARRAISPM
jgi:hypothetical protein